MSTTAADVNAIAMALPETTLEGHYGSPSYKVKGKFFARIHENGALVAKMNIDQRELLCELHPEKFFYTDHYRNWAGLLVRLEAIGRGELEEILTEAWRMSAPPKVRKAWEALR